MVRLPCGRRSMWCSVGHVDTPLPLVDCDSIVYGHMTCWAQVWFVQASVASRTTDEKHWNFLSVHVPCRLMDKVYPDAPWYVAHLPDSHTLSQTVCFHIHKNHLKQGLLMKTCKCRKCMYAEQSCRCLTPITFGLFFLSGSWTLLVCLNVLEHHGRFSPGLCLDWQPAVWLRGVKQADTISCCGLHPCVKSHVWSHARRPCAGPDSGGPAEHCSPLM